MRLPGFPVPVAGETLASVVARYLARSASPRMRNLELLGLRHTRANCLIPRDLPYLVNIMPWGHPWSGDAKSIVQRHTLAPLFLQAANFSHYTATIAAMAEGLSGNPAATLGLTIKSSNSLIQHGNARFCPDCLEMDLRERGFPVLYRQHQPEFVKHCAVHSRPLLLCCVRCQGSLGAFCMWRMAGQCNCEQPLHPSVLSSKVDSKTEEIYLWLAKQVNALLAAAASQQHVSIAPGLESALRQDGFTTSGGRIRNRLIVQTMIERFGTDLLKELGLAMWINTRHSRASPVASIQRCKKEHTQVPNILHVLLTANLIVDDVLKLKNNSYTHATHVHPHLGKRPDGRMARQRTTKDSIESALSTTNGILNSAAKLLNLSPQNLLTDIRYHHVLLRLSKTQIDRIGGGQIEAARTALRDGMSMQELCQSLGISKWSVTLIQADDPSLYKLHQEGKVTKKRRNNREIILAFMASRPFAGRTELRRTHYYTVEFARKHENEWLEKNLPTSVPRSGKRAGKIRINWEERDSKVQIAVLEEVNAELKKTGRPIRLTITRLKSAAGLLSSNYNRVPSPQYQQIILDINKLVESRVAFRLRLIKWAMQEYSKLHIPISSNKLRRIARLPIAQLLECRPVVIACAEELQLEFHSSCSLSPLATRYPTQK